MPFDAMNSEIDCQNCPNLTLDIFWSKQRIPTSDWMCDLADTTLTYTEKLGIKLQSTVLTEGRTL